MTNSSKIYVIGPLGGPYKIGISNNPESRLSDLQLGNPAHLRLELTYDTANALIEEKLFHEELKEYSVRGEWFSCSLELISLAAKSVLYTKVFEEIGNPDFKDWLMKMNDSGYPEHACQTLLNVSDSKMRQLKAEGGSTILGLACAALYHRFKPYKKT